MFFLNDAPATEIYTLSLHDALPIWPTSRLASRPTCRSSSSGPTSPAATACTARSGTRGRRLDASRRTGISPRSEEHTSELQSRQYLVCRLLLEKTQASRPFPHRAYL